MSEINKLKWLAGQWEGILGSGIYHEEWESISDTELSGRAYLIRKGEISDNEKLKIHSAENSVYYTAEVSHNPEPVSFKLTTCEKNIFIFENPGHDFPKKIKYEKINDNNFIATAEADNNGKNRKLIFDLKRIT